MATTLKFNFPIAVLTQQGDAILDAAEARATDLAARLPASRVAEIRALHKTVSDSSSGQQDKGAELGTLTQEQNRRLQTLNDLLSKARATAKRAFAGQDVKLRDDFQVGINKPSDLAAVLARARTVLAACQKTDNATALTGKGWIAGDTEALSAAIDGLDTADDTQETAKAGRKGATVDRNVAANNLYDGLLDIQNAADLQYPARNAANVAVRAEFKLGSFPPRNHGGKEPPKPDQPAAPSA